MALGINRLREKKGYTFLLTRIFAVLVLSILFVSAVNESIEYVNESLSINLSPDVSNLIIDNVCDGESLMNISRENYSVDLVDSSGEKLEFEIRVEKSSSSNSFSIASSSLPVVEIILEDSPVKGLIFDNLNLDVGGSLGIDDVSEDIEAPVGKWAEVYAIDPEDLEFDSAEVSVVATGSKLYKCKDWVFGEARCAGDWVFFMDVVPGQEYTFTLTPNDPGFGEIVAIDAVHLGEDYSFISNIYDDVAVVDGVWSEAVYEGEVVRVDFEEDLVDGNVIDVVVRSNSTLAYFEVYEAGTDNLVGRSGAVNGVELVYTMVSGLSEPTDSFDLKVVKVVYDDEDNTSSVDMSAYSFLEFDFIHDDYITSSQADGFFVYEELNIQAPRYRTWDESNAFSAELIDAGTVSGNILWTVVKGSHERDEMIVGTQDNANDVNVQVYGSSWGNLLEVSSDVVNSAYRAFDIEYEGVSGDALIVYENSSAANSVLTYRIWNGTGYSSEQTLTTLLSNAVHWVSLVSKTGTDDVMLLAHDSASSLYAVPWNGTAFDLTRDIILSSGTVSSTKQHFDFAWEGSNGDGLVSYGEGNNLAYRNYTYSSGSWGSASTIALGNGLNGVRMCSDVNSDYIGMIWVDAGADVNASMWNGATIIGGLSPDTGVEINGVNNVNVDCAWETSGEVALFGFIDRNQLSMDYFTFTKSGESWSTTSLTSTGVLANFATDDTAGLRFVENPVTDEIMVVGQDIAEDVDVVRWDGSAFQTISSSPVESATGVLNGAQESAMFDWYRYDPSPFVKDLTLVDGTVYNATDSVNITFNVTDNIEIDDVFVDVIFPNSTIVRYGVSNSSSVYNLTFSDSDLIGNYVVRVIANDTSIYQNVNSSETVSFLVAEWNKPNVSLIVPTLNSEYNISDSLEIAVDVTDDNSVDYVFANITYPNSTIVSLELSYSFGDKYNSSFVVPALLGDYDIVFVANDSSGNINSSVESNFSVSDVVAPVVLDLGCNPSSLNLSQNVICNISVTDDVSIDIVFANITYPNSTVVFMEVNNVTDNYYFSFSGTSLTGQYNVSWFANDSSGNVGVNSSSFIVSDVVVPEVSGIVPTLNSEYNISDVIEIAVDVMDDLEVDYVFANLTLPNLTSVILPLSFASGDKYNSSFVVPALLGNYDIVFIANDSSGNINSSVESNFSVSDVVAPVVLDLECNPSSLNLSQNVICNVSATDDVSIDTVLANITYSNGTSVTVAVSNVTDNYYFSFALTSLIGQYNVSWFANDSSGNVGENSSYFIVSDVIVPVVSSVLPTLNSEYNISDSFEIAVDVTDDLEVDYVFANLTLPNLTSVILPLSFVSGNKYNSSFVVSALLGDYDIVFVANDSSGNVNSSVESNFSVSDVVAPRVDILDPSIGSNFLQNDDVLLSVDVMDDMNVSYVYINMTYPNLTVINIPLTDDNFDEIYNITFNDTNKTGTYDISVFANDSSGNINATEVRSFNIQESDAPLVSLIGPANNARLNSNDVTLVCDSTDAGGLANVTLYHNIGQAFGANETRDISGSSNSSNFTINDVSDGTYIWNCITRDTFSNEAFGIVNFTFTVDTVLPVVSSVSPSVGSVYNISNVVEISADVTDDESVDEVFANITFPNSTVVQLSLTYSSGNKYNNSFIASVLLGVYDVLIIANDSSGNINATEVGGFNVTDVVVPIVLDLECNPSSLNLSQNVICNVSVTDDVSIDTVLANVTYSNGTSVTVAVSNVTDNYYFSFALTSLTGQYNVSWFANDSSGNVGANSSSFVVSDVVVPVVSSVLPTLNSEYNISDSFEIAVDVTDDLEVDYVFANLTLPNLTSVILPLSFASGNKYNSSFVVPALLGDYDIVFVANDSSGNINSSVESNFSVSDVVAPLIEFTLPVSNSVYNISNVVEIAVDVTDDLEVDYVFANLTLPNLTSVILPLSFSSGDKYNSSFVVPALLGDYDIVFVANDSSGNINSSVESNFSVSDVVAPVVLDLECNPSSLNLSQNVICNVSVTDDVSIDTVLANVTYSNGTSVTVAVSNVTDNYYFSFALTSLTGQYNVSWFANDSSGNVGENSSYFIVSDVVVPVVSSVLPIDGFNVSNVTGSVIDFNFSVSDNYDATLNCSIFVDSVLEDSNSSVLSGVFTLFSVAIFSEGDHNWTVNCTDSSGNSNESMVRFFKIDNSAPSFVSLITNPNSIDGLDPNVNITVLADVSEALTSVDSVLLQYKMFNESSYVNSSMSFNGTSGFYEDVLNVSDSGIYNLRLFANDSVGNGVFSNVVNRTIEFDYSWTTNPANSFAPVNANFSDDITFGEFVVSNTGDFALDFNITSDSAETIYNESENFSLAPGEIKVLSINDTATLAGVKMISFDVDSFIAGSNESVSSKVITGAIVVAPNQPALVTRFLTPSTGALTVSQGASGVQFVAELENIGEGDAYNTTFFYEFPANWTITFGSSSIEFEDEFYVGDTAENVVEITVPSDASVGDYEVKVKVSAVNSSGFDLGSAGLIFDDVVIVTVQESASSVGSSGGGDTTTPSSPAPSSSDSSSSGKKIDGGDSETIYTTEKFSVIRGTTEFLPITITNLYENAVFENLNLNLQGFLTQYVKISYEFDPDKLVYIESKNIKLFGQGASYGFNFTEMGSHSVTLFEIRNDSADFVISSNPINVSLDIKESQNVDLDGDGVSDSAITLWDITDGVAQIWMHKLGSAEEDRLYFLESRDYTFEVFAPPYLEKQDYEVTLEISADLVALDSVAAGFESKSFLEHRKITFALIEKSSDEAVLGLADAKAVIFLMSEAGFPVEKIKGLLAQAEDSFELLDYEAVLEFVNKILELGEISFEADVLIKEIQGEIDNAKERWLETIQTENSLVLAVKAFERGDYRTALVRAKDAQLALILETKGRFDLLWVLVNYWWAIIVGSMILSFLLFVSYKYSYMFILNQRLKLLTKEESSINVLMEEAQVCYLMKGSLSTDRYKRAIAQYEERLNEIRHLRVSLRNKRVGILRTDQELLNLSKERSDLEELMKKTQTDYFKKEKLTERKFKSLHNLEKERLAELDEEKMILEEKCIQEKGTVKYKLLMILNGVNNKTKKFFKKMVRRK